jgi:inner membrane protein
LLAIEYHRHFTHSLAFIPLGGLLTALPLFALPKLRPLFRWVLASTTLGYATHAVLDACTTYGTLLFWPFSDFRVALHIVSIVDPVFTLPLLASVIWAASKKRVTIARAGLAFSLLYLCFGVVQRERASAVQRSLAEHRGHAIERGVVLPSFLNNVTWRSLYVARGRTYVDKIRVPWFGRGCASEGASAALVPAPDLASLHPVVARGERLIRWFSDGWVAPDPDDPSVLGDLRYSFSPQEVTPIWGIRPLPVGAVPSARTGIEWVNNNARRNLGWAALGRLIFDDDERAVCF